MISWLRWIVLTWTSVALLASPLLAATQCWECCSAHWELLEAGEPHASISPQPACCHAARCDSSERSQVSCSSTEKLSVAFADYGLNCPQCEKCAAVRSEPVDREASAPEFQRSLTGGLSWTGPLQSLPLNLDVERGRVCFASRGELPAPPLQVMFCTWQK